MFYRIWCKGTSEVKHYNEAMMKSGRGIGSKFCCRASNGNFDNIPFFSKLIGFKLKYDKKWSLIVY